MMYFVKLCKYCEFEIFSGILREYMKQNIQRKFESELIYTKQYMEVT
jgi:hypothetical protein